MLAIRLQRTGRKGHANFRLVVQDSRQSPSSGKVIANLGSYDPHTKTTGFDKAKAGFYLEHGAQPSDRVVRLLKQEGVKLPKWVSVTADNKRAIRNPEKLRRNRPPQAAETPPPAEPAAADEAASTEPVAPTEAATPEPTEPTESVEPAETPAEPANEPAEPAPAKEESDPAAEAK